MDFVINRGGKLVSNSGEDVSDIFPRFIHNTVSIADNTRLIDIFKLCEQHIDIISLLVSESATRISKIIDSAYGSKESDIPDTFNNLVLRWNMGVDEDSYLIERLDLSCEGVPEADSTLYNSGEIITYSLTLTPVKHIAYLPVVLKSDAALYDYSSNGLVTDPLMKLNKETSLLEVLQGIFWELTFIGSEDDKVTELKRLNKIIDKIMVDNDT